MPSEEVVTRKDGDIEKRKKEQGDGPPVGALDPNFVPDTGLDSIKAALKAAFTMEKPGLVAAVRDILGKLNETQIGLLSMEDIVGLPSANNCPYGMGNLVEMLVHGGVETHSNIAERNPAIQIYTPFPAAMYNTVLADLDKVIGFINTQGANSTDTANVKTALSHAALRMAYGEGNLVSMRGAGYAVVVNGGCMAVVNTTPGTEGMAFIPKALSGESKQRIRSALIVTVLQEEVPAQGNIEAHTVTNKLMTVSINADSTVFPFFTRWRAMYRYLAQQSTAAGVTAQRRFVFTILKCLLRCLFVEIPNPIGSVFDTHGGTVIAYNAVNAVPQAQGGGPGPGSSLKRRRADL